MNSPSQPAHCSPVYCPWADVLDRAHSGSGCVPYERTSPAFQPAGFPAEDILVAGEAVYVGRDAEVSLAASREMLQAPASSKEQYRTNNLVAASVTKICVDGPGFTGVFSTALDRAIQNYEELPLSFSMARTPSTGCSFTINAVIDPNMNGGVAGFPSNGLPYARGRRRLGILPHHQPRRLERLPDG